VFRSRVETLSGDTSPITCDDLVVAMPACVAINKAIELAIQLVAGLEAQRTQLEDVPGGLERITDGFPQQARLSSYCRRVRISRTIASTLIDLSPTPKDIDVTLAYAGKVVVPDQKFVPADPDHFSFYSTYQTVDLVCYPPEHEGFGNQAIETV